jgi:nitroreductase
MNVSEAVARRKAVRAFRPQPVDGEVVRGILAAARRAPSGGNIQPWRIYALGGDVLAAFKADIAGKFSRGVREAPEYAVYPPGLWQPYRARRDETREERYAALGFAVDDRRGEHDLALRNFDFFGAPVGLFFCIEQRMGPPQWADVGMLMQTVMLLAVEQGLDTCPQEIWARWPVTIREFLRLPPEEMVFAGMSMGYRDPDHPLNRLQTRREPLESVASLRGF